MSHLCSNLSMVSHHTQYKTQIPDQGPQASIQDSPANLFDLITLLFHVLDTSLKKLQFVLELLSFVHIMDIIF